MPMLSQGNVYMEPRQPQRTLRDETSDVTNFMLQLKMQEYLKQKELEQADVLRKQELQDAITKSAVEGVITGKATIAPGSPMAKRLGEFDMEGVSAVNPLAALQGGDAGGLDLEGLNIKGLRFGKEKELTPAQQAAQETTTRQEQAWLSGQKVGKEEPPRTQEEAYWGMMGRGSDPTQFQEGLRGLPSQEKYFGGKPATWPGALQHIQRLAPGIGRREGFKPPIPAGVIQPGQIVGKFQGGQQSQQQDPITQRIAEARQQGIPDSKIASDLREVGIDPSRYGL